MTISVCEGAVCPLAASLGVRWGRWNEGPVEEPHQVEGSSVFRALRRDLGVHVPERVRVSAPASAQAPSRPQELKGEGALACVILQGTVLLSVRTQAGFTGLLCEAGDWVLLPAGVPHVFDAGTTPELEFLRLSQGRRGWFPLHTGVPLPPDLPRLDELVEQLLLELGEELEDGA